MKGCPFGRLRAEQRLPEKLEYNFKQYLLYHSHLTLFLNLKVLWSTLPEGDIPQYYEYNNSILLWCCTQLTAPSDQQQVYTTTISSRFIRRRYIYIWYREQ